VELVQIEDDDVVYEFTGTLIAGPVSTRLDAKDRQRARWMEASLYRKSDDTYVFTQVSISTVWHQLDGASHVRKPSWTHRGDLPDRAVYCGVLPVRPGREHCPPMTLEESRDPRNIPGLAVTEQIQRRVWTCPDRDSVIARMTVAHYKSDGARSAAVSGPMGLLLDQAAENDPAFRTSEKPVVQI
jgi:hypothetical protein